MTNSLRFMTATRPEVKSPARIAAVSALIYFVLCTLYIVLSTLTAAESSNTKEQLRAIEVTKGVGFAVVTGLMFFTISWARWKRILQQESTIRGQEELLISAERKSVAAMYAASIAHDLRNLLMSLSGLLEELKERETGDDFLTSIRKELENDIANLIRFSRRVTSAATPMPHDVEENIDIAAALPLLIAIVRKHPDVRFCDIKLPGGAVKALLRKSLFDEAVLNLVINAAQASGPRGNIEIRLETEGEATVLEVHDSGPGIPDAILETIFDPGFTTKPNGTGLGLLAVQAFVSSCGGELSVEKSPLGGALFRIRIKEQKQAQNQ